MSYATPLRLSLGTTEPYYGLFPDKTKVYGLRFIVHDVDLAGMCKIGTEAETPQPMQDFLQFVGVELPDNYDVHGITLHQVPVNPDEGWKFKHYAVVSVVLRFRGTIDFVIPYKSADVIKAALNDGDWKKFFGQAGGYIDQAEWITVTGAANVLIFWQLAPMLWDSALEMKPSYKHGGPTQAFMDRLGVYRGHIDFPKDPIALKKVSPPPPPPPPPKDQPTSLLPKDQWTIPLLVGGVGVVVMAGYFVFLKKPMRKAA